ncbi:MAG: FKBP-type peptidyl-prolyl cis-trans isomerase [Actinobacteria bacterium]|nr:FKBP-type peptidyl-prolyl cis-trans isomerase [Actinomycetota bacterium]
MRKLPAGIAVLSLLAVALVGCSTSASASCDRTAAGGTSAIDGITVTGTNTALPVVAVNTPFHVDSAEFTDLSTGSGTPITTNDQLVVLDLSLTSGATGKTLVTTSYDGSLSRVFPVSRWVQSFPGFEGALKCATTGTRITVALPPGGVEAQTAKSLGIGTNDSTVAVIDVRKVYLAKADGADQYNQGFGLPVVVRAPNGRPGIIVPDSAPPSNLVVQVLKKGDGEVVTGDAPARLAYTGVVWAGKTQFETTWDGDPQSITLSSMVKGFQDAVKGQTVGSEIMVVVPPDQGYGQSQQGSVPAGSTLVYVIDILGIDAPAATQ